MRIELEIHGDEIMSRELLRSAGRVVNAKPAFESILSMMEDDVGEQFASEGKAMSKGWAPLSPVTIAQKSRLNLRPEILQATGRLLNSLVVGARGEDIHEAMPYGLNYGTRVPYAVFHHTGTRKMPARKFVDFTAAQKAKYVKVLQRYIVEGVGF